MVNFVYAIRGVFFLPPGKNMEVFFGDSSTPFFVCKLALLQIQILVADLIMVSVTTLVCCLIETCAP